MPIPKRPPLSVLSVYPVRVMKTSLLAYWIIVTLAAIANLMLPTPVMASDAVALDFSLSTAEPAAVQETKPTVEPLAIPATGTAIPSGRFDENKALTELPPPPALPSSVAQRLEPPSPQPSEEAAPAPLYFAAIAPAPAAPPPHPVTSSPAGEAIAPPDAPPALESPPPVPGAIGPGASPSPEDGLQFEPFDVAALPPSPLDTQDNPPQARSQGVDLDSMFAGGPDSLVARAIGSAEGTRTPEGGRTRAYGGHRDPGNGRWNMGTFSYQHGASTPEEADQKQMERLRGQANTLQAKAEEYGLQMNLEEKLNALDLANQSPRAALSRGGYVDRLKESYEMGLRGSEAILWARTRSFLDPDTNRWNAPGLGNTVERITADQERRRRAIDRAIAARPQDTVAGDRPPDPSPTLSTAATPSNSPGIEGQNSDSIVNFDLSASPPSAPPTHRQFLFSGT